MKKLFAVALLLNLNLYTMERIQKEFKKYHAKDYDKLIEMDKKEFYNKMTNMTINDIKKNIKKRVERTDDSDCFPRFSRFISSALTTTRHYLNH
jgi:hypothetical protein